VPLGSEGYDGRPPKTWLGRRRTRSQPSPVRSSPSRTLKTALRGHRHPWATDLLSGVLGATRSDENCYSASDLSMAPTALRGLTAHGAPDRLSGATWATKTAQNCYSLTNLAAAHAATAAVDLPPWLNRPDRVASAVDRSAGRGRRWRRCLVGALRGAVRRDGLIPICWRGPMGLGACRRVLCDNHEAEDAFWARPSAKY